MIIRHCALQMYSKIYCKTAETGGRRRKSHIRVKIYECIRLSTIKFNKQTSKQTNGRKQLKGLIENYSSELNTCSIWDFLLELAVVAQSKQL